MTLLCVESKFMLKIFSGFLDMIRITAVQTTLSCAMCYVFFSRFLALRSLPKKSLIRSKKCLVCFINLLSCNFNIV